jgi:Predicted RNA-binding protein (contains KH domain)
MSDEYDSSDEFDDEDDLDLLDEDEDLEDEDDLPDEVGAEGNRLVGGLPKGVLEYLARNIVDDPDAVFVETSEGRGEVELRLHVAPGDMGKVIGRRGRVAQALRQVVAAAGSREGVRASLDIVD